MVSGEDKNIVHTKRNTTRQGNGPKSRLLTSLLMAKQQAFIIIDQIRACTVEIQMISC